MPHSNWLHDFVPFIVWSCTKLKVSGPSLPLCDYLVIDLRNDKELVEISLEERKLSNDRQMDQRAAVSHNRHGPCSS